MSQPFTENGVSVSDAGVAAAISYAKVLSHHLPDMASGFTIRTNHGELAITREESRRHSSIRQEVEAIFRARHRAATTGEHNPPASDEPVTKAVGFHTAPVFPEGMF